MNPGNPYASNRTDPVNIEIASDDGTVDIGSSFSLNCCLCPMPSNPDPGEEWTCPSCGRHYVARETVVWEESFPDSMFHTGFATTPTQPRDLSLPSPPLEGGDEDHA